MAKDEFLQLVEQQLARLRITYSAEELHRLTTEFYAFQTAVDTEPILNTAAQEALTRHRLVVRAGSCLHNRFPLLAGICRRHSQPSLAGHWRRARKTSLSQELQHLSWTRHGAARCSISRLEGMLHARQKMRIEVGGH
ncbi:hypothetical protein PINS_up010045 [Pythium insidiosum]|nr:hypothetical protein PINS_up010045 [Pythium insidiosum]